MTKRKTNTFSALVGVISALGLFLIIPFGAAYVYTSIEGTFWAKMFWSAMWVFVISLFMYWATTEKEQAND